MNSNKITTFRAFCVKCGKRWIWTFNGGNCPDKCETCLEAESKNWFNTLDKLREKYQ